MTDFGRRPGDMFTSDYDADEDGVIDEDASFPHTHVHATTTQKDADDHTQYHTNNRGDARYLQLQNLLHGWCLADQYKQIIQGTWLFSHGGSTAWQTLLYNHPHAINDEIEYELFAQAGQRTFEVLTKIAADAAIMTISLDGVPQGTIDNYAAVNDYNQYKTLAVTVIGTEKHTIGLKATDKHASSTGYYMFIGWIRIK